MKRLLWLGIASLIVLALVLGSCGGGETVQPPATQTTGTTPATTTPTTPATTTPTTTPVQPAPGTREEPKYGGTLRVLGTSPTVDPLSWDPADWAWKVSQDTTFYFEHLLGGDLDKGPRGTKEFDFLASDWIPDPIIRGVLAESWEIQTNPLALVFRLRKGVYWQAKQGVMASREFEAKDVVYSMTRLFTSPKQIALYMGGPTRWEVRDKYTAVCYMDTFFANWKYAIGHGYYDVIAPEEVVKAGIADWRNHTGTGPYMITDYVSASSQTYTKNPNYWDKETINGKRYQLPYADRIIILIMKDESTRLAALRTGKVDLSLTNDWKFVDTLKQTSPELKMNKSLGTGGGMLALRMDTKPFDDIRVRRALNMAVNKQGLIDTLYNGNGVILHYPFANNWPGLFTPMEQLPTSARELYVYDKEKAKKLLAEAGYPNGFIVKAMVSNASAAVDWASYVAANLAEVGVKLDLMPIEYAQTVSAQITKTHTPAFFFTSSHGNPIAVLRKNFLPGQQWNPYIFDDKSFTDRYTAVIANPNDAERDKVLKELNVYAIDQAPAIWLPTQAYFTYWWPWVKNYYGELYSGSLTWAPILTRIWVDQDLKKKMGY
ncbi:MAG: ABC transporter substrate-binding protein [Dehalococcoidia bacterium]|nr:ABC transporter substrate-binding protein [Dehalococcoidia bacterium]